MIQAILAADPGVATGFTYWAAAHATSVPGGWELPHMQFLAWADQFITSAHTGELVVVCEDFIINPGTARKPGSRFSIEQIGALRYFASRGSHDFVLQTPADAKGFASTEKLRQVGWYKHGRPHANDALRHLLLYFARLGWYDGRTMIRPVLERTLP